MTAVAVEYRYGFATHGNGGSNKLGGAELCTSNGKDYHLLSTVDGVRPGEDIGKSVPVLRRPVLRQDGLWAVITFFALKIFYYREWEQIEIQEGSKCPELILARRTYTFETVFKREPKIEEIGQYDGLSALCIKGTEIAKMWFPSTLDQEKLIEMQKWQMKLFKSFNANDLTEVHIEVANYTKSKFNEQTLRSIEKELSEKGVPQEDLNRRIGVWSEGYKNNTLTPAQRSLYEVLQSISLKQLKLLADT